jgi:hypothetical protein
MKTNTMRQAIVERYERICLKGNGLGLFLTDQEVEFKKDVLKAWSYGNCRCPEGHEPTPYKIKKLYNKWCSKRS